MSKGKVYVGEDPPPEMLSKEVVQILRGCAELAEKGMAPDESRGFMLIHWAGDKVSTSALGAANGQTNVKIIQTIVQLLKVATDEMLPRAIGNLVNERVHKAVGMMLAEKEKAAAAKPPTTHKERH